jgi:predicted DCC family thiol-disulfide oxidoreductase YuxK
MDAAGLPGGLSTPEEPELLFYDGGCGLCHRAVRFVLWADPEGRAFRFAPLGGETFQALVPAGERERLPDSLVARTAAGVLLTRSTGALHALRRLGGAWRALAVLLGVVPRPIRDVVYDFVARVRFRLFARPKDACPFVPPPLRSRFLH